MIAMILPLLLLSPTVTMTPAEGDRFRLSVTFPANARPGEHMEAQVALSEEAAKLCKGKGRPVSAGGRQVADVPATATKRRQLALSGEWRCVPRMR